MIGRWRGRQRRRGKRGQSLRRQNNETECEEYDLTHAQVAKTEKQIQPPGEHSRELESTGKVEDISKELQTLALELGITDGSHKEIIEAARRKANDLEELKKAVFSVNTVKVKEHDIEKAKAKIQDLHRCQEDLKVVKTAVMNPNKRKNFKLKQSTEEVVEKIDTLHGCQEDLTVIKTAVMNPNKSKDFKLIQSTKEVVERIFTLYKRAKELESNLEELKKVVFLVTKVKEKEHNIEKTKAKIQDLHSYEKELTTIKTAVMNPNKSKDFKPTEPAEVVVERINTLYGCQEDLTLVKTAVMNPTKSMDFKPTKTTEKIVERINALHGMYKKMEANQKMLCAVILGKNKQPNMEEALNAVQVLKKAADESKNDIQQKKAGLEQMEKEIDLLKTQLKETETLLKTYQEREQKLLNDLKEVKSQKENALIRTADESKTEIQQQKTTLEKMEKEITELRGQLKDAENKHHTLLKRNQEREQKLTDEINDVRSQREKALTRLSEVAGAKLTESNPYITDLSDPNRPEKIGEQFSELYDTLWVDVFEKLSGTCKLSERDSIQTLLQILEDSYGYCKDISSKRYSNTLAELTLWKFVEPNETPSQKKEGKNNPKKKKGADTEETTVNITLDELQKLQTLLDSPSSSSPAYSKAVDSILAKIGLNVTNLSNIKKMLKSSLEGTSVIVQESFWKQRSEDPNGRKEVLECTKPFLMKCVHICWLMVGQDPPVYLRFSDKCKDKFNKHIYREYTTNGEVLDFVVWPAIFLHENGPLLKKGLAQPISKK